MNSDAGGWLWLAIDVLFVAVFAAGLIYGIAMWHKRRGSRALQRESEQATRDLYQKSGNQ
jgi:hypothetical protein